MLTESLRGHHGAHRRLRAGAGRVLRHEQPPRGRPHRADASREITALGFPVTDLQMTDLAASMGEATLFGRTGGAPTLAVGMARCLPACSAAAGDGLWYHFAIMFEALFILTTIDAGTRVGRFIVQDFLGLSGSRSATQNPFPATRRPAALFVGCVGLLPLPGRDRPARRHQRSQPALAALRHRQPALCSRRSSARPHRLAIARGLEAKIAAGGTPTELATWKSQVLNNHIDVAVTGRSWCWCSSSWWPVRGCGGSCWPGNARPTCMRSPTWRCRRRKR
jgi:carbon starvation protein